jgi:hypothetical protein
LNLAAGYASALRDMFSAALSLLLRHGARGTDQRKKSS